MTPQREIIERVREAAQVLMESVVHLTLRDGGDDED